MMNGTDLVILRSAVGEENYPDLVRVCERLDSLGCRLALSQEGIDRLMRTLAEELVAQRLAITIANDAGLTGGEARADTPRSEDTET